MMSRTRWIPWRKSTSLAEKGSATSLNAASIGKLMTDMFIALSMTLQSKTLRHQSVNLRSHETNSLYDLILFGDAHSYQAVILSTFSVFVQRPATIEISTSNLSVVSTFTSKFRFSFTQRALGVPLVLFGNMPQCVLWMRFMNAFPNCSCKKHLFK